MSDAKVDGRRIYRMTDRAESVADTRRGILDAVIALDPTASLGEVADSAGVSSRTVLRHFGSKEGLIAAAIDHADEEVAAQRFAVPAGDIPAITLNLVDHYEQWGDRVLSFLAREGQSDVLGPVLESGRRLHRRWVIEKLGPIVPGSGGVRELRIAQLVAVTDVLVWKLLRRDQGLSRSKTQSALKDMIELLTQHSPKENQ